MGGSVSHTSNKSETFIDHVGELRIRLVWSCLAIVAGAAVGYFLHDTLLGIVQKPLGQALYNTTPTGAFSFVIKVCVVFGLLVGLPIIMYQLFSFLGPLLSKKSKGVIALYTFFSVVLAIAGSVFAYFISLPAALNFLVNFGNDTNIQSIITANEYFNFAFAYILGMAAIFQLPLLLLFINRVKPLKPASMFKGTRYVLVISFIAAAIITPTPDPFNQALMAGPIIVLYLASITLVALINLRRKPAQQAKFEIKKPAAQQPSAKRPSRPTPERTFSPTPLARPQFAMDIATARVHAATISTPAPRPTVQTTPMQRSSAPRLISDFRASA